MWGKRRSRSHSNKQAKRVERKANRSTRKRISPESNSEHHSEEVLKGSLSHLC